MPALSPLPDFLLHWLLTSTVLLGAWWGGYRLVLRSERSFGYNRAYLVAGPLLAAALPLLPLAWPAAWGWGLSWAGIEGWLASWVWGWNAAAPAQPLAAAQVLLPAVQVGGRALPVASWAFGLTLLYLGGAGLGLGRLGFGLGQLWLTARALPRERHPGYTLRRTGGRLPTSSFGRVVFWDETLPLTSAEAHQVLAHELAHVQQRHTLDRLLLSILQALLWPNPFVHLSARALALTHEFLADAAALRPAAAAEAGAKATATTAQILPDTTEQETSNQQPATTNKQQETPAAYARLLARQVVAQLGFSAPLAHTFSPSHTLTRIAMLHQTHPPRRWKQWLALPLLALLLGTVAHSQTAPPPVPAPPTSPPAVYGFLPSAPPTPPPPPAVYQYVEQMPELPSGGGPNALTEFIRTHLKYPEVPAAEQFEGKVFVSFIVAKTGEVQAVKILRSLAPAYDEAVLAAVRQLPRFRPGRKSFPASQGGPRPAAVSYTVPLIFARSGK